MAVSTRSENKIPDSRGFPGVNEDKTGWYKHENKHEIKQNVKLNQKTIDIKQKLTLNTMVGYIV